MDGRVFGGGVLEFEQRQRQPVDEQHHVRAAVGFGVGLQVDIGDGELVDRQPVVRRRMVVIDQPDLIVPLLPAVAVADIDAFGEQAVEGVIVDQRVLALGARDLADRLVEDGVPDSAGNVRIDALQRRAQPTEQQHLAVSGTFRRRLAGRDVAAEGDAVAEFAQPFQRRLLDDVFVEAAHCCASMMSSASPTLICPLISLGSSASRSSASVRDS